MPSTKRHVLERTKPQPKAAASKRPRRPVPSRLRSATRLAVRPREAFITDPQALLAAMAAAERQDAPAPRSLRAVELPTETGVDAPQSVSFLAQPLPPRPEPVMHALPALRDGERVGRSTDDGVVVIIRRRRAA